MKKNFYYPKQCRGKKQYQTTEKQKTQLGGSSVQKNSGKTNWKNLHHLISKPVNVTGDAEEKGKLARGARVEVHRGGE